MLPVVELPASVTERPTLTQTAQQVHCVQRVEQAAAAIEADKLDALVLTGGADVEPARYGAERRPETQDVDAARDESELRLLDAFVAAGKPVLGICRGIQVLNALYGGTLHQHLPLVIGDLSHRPGPGRFGEIEVLTEAGSEVAKAMGESARVMCCHHQSIDRLGEGLRVTARSADGVIEAVERDAPGSQFMVAVQWHPEQSGDTRLFRALVEAC